MTASKTCKSSLNLTGKLLSKRLQTKYHLAVTRLRVRRAKMVLIFVWIKQVI
jgi:hypothetical protein